MGGGGATSSFGYLDAEDKDADGVDDLTQKRVAYMNSLGVDRQQELRNVFKSLKGSCDPPVKLLQSAVQTYLDDHFHKF